MVIARARGRDGADLLVLGLSDANRRRLDDGHFIELNVSMNTSAAGTPLYLIIFAGATEEAMQEQLQELIGPDTVIQSLGAQGRPQ